MLRCFPLDASNLLALGLASRLCAASAACASRASTVRRARQKALNRKDSRQSNAAENQSTFHKLSNRQVILRSKNAKRYPQVHERLGGTRS
jgi:hypothetical protein